MRAKLDGQLEMLNTELIKMGSLCEEALSCAVKALFERSERFRIKTASIEREVDAKERDIETLCMRLLLQQQPVAADLRTVSSAMRMISDMERIGDQAEDIAELSKSIGGGDVINEVHLHDMANGAARMVINSVDSFVRRDLKLAKQVILADDDVDRRFNTVKELLIKELAQPGSDKESCLNILMAAKYLERIGDHATNIAEWVEYSITGHKDVEE